MEGDLNLLQTIIIAIVEGLTEFLPVSSTGHMIIAQNMLGVKKHRVRKGIYLYHPVRCHPVGCSALLETLFPAEPHTGSRRKRRIATFSPQV